jgi:hypothetical protein
MSQQSFEGEDAPTATVLAMEEKGKFIFTDMR